MNIRHPDHGQKRRVILGNERDGDGVGASFGYCDKHACPQSALLIRELHSQSTAGTVCSSSTNKHVPVCYDDLREGWRHDLEGVGAAGQGQGQAHHSRDSMPHILPLWFLPREDKRARDIVFSTSYLPSLSRP